MAEPRMPRRYHLPGFGPRWHAVLFTDEPMLCPARHRLGTNAAALDHRSLTCTTRIGAQGECGRHIYVLSLDYGLKLLLELSRAELYAITNQRMRPGDIVQELRKNTLKVSA